MAYMSQENKAKLAVEIRKVVPADWKYTLSVKHHSTLVLTISQAPIDLIGQNIVSQSRGGDRPAYVAINEYYIEREYAPKLADIFKKIKAAMMIGNHDNSEPQTDFFDVGWYIDIKVGAFERPFKFVPVARKRKTWARCSICKQATYVCSKRGCLSYSELKNKVAALEAAAQGGR